MYRVFQIAEIMPDHFFQAIRVNITYNDKRLQIGPVPIFIKAFDNGAFKVIKYRIQPYWDTHCITGIIKNHRPVYALHTLTRAFAQTLFFQNYTTLLINFD